MTFFPFLDVVERDLTGLLRIGFLAPAAALVVFRFVVFVDGLFAADAGFDAFFFGGADAGFTFRFDTGGTAS